MSEARLVFKVSDVAKLLDVSVQTVYSMIRNGQLLALDIRSSKNPKYVNHRITRASLDAYLTECEQRQPPVARRASR